MKSNFGRCQYFGNLLQLLLFAVPLLGSSDWLTDAIDGFDEGGFGLTGDVIYTNALSMNQNTLAVTGALVIDPDFSTRWENRESAESGAELGSLFHGTASEVFVGTLAISVGTVGIESDLEEAKEKQKILAKYNGRAYFGSVYTPFSEMMPVEDIPLLAAGDSRSLLLEKVRNFVGANVEGWFNANYKNIGLDRLDAGYLEVSFGNGSGNESNRKWISYIAMPTSNSPPIYGSSIPTTGTIAIDINGTGTGPDGVSLENGTTADPILTFSRAYRHATNGSTLVLETGNYPESLNSSLSLTGQSSSIVLDRPMTIEAKGGTVILGQ